MRTPGAASPDTAASPTTAPFPEPTERRRPVPRTAGLDAAPRPPVRPASILRPRTWTLWTLGRPVVAYVLVVDALAVLVGVVAARTEPVSGSDLPLFGLLALGGAVHQEVVRAVERRATRTDLPRRVHIQFTALWPFTALLLLPVGLAFALVLVDYLHWGLRRPRRSPPLRCVFAAASIVLALSGAWLLVRLAPVDELLGGRGGPLALAVIAGAVLVRAAVAYVLIAALVAAMPPTSAGRLRLTGTGDALLGLGGLGLGVVLAAVATTRPWLAVLVVVPLVAMQHGLMLTPLAHAACTDDKTGVAEAEHWRLAATRALARATHAAPVAVLMVDLDHFKAVNDTWGHLAGDRALRAVAQALTGAVRPGDLVGRFGGEEFAVLLTAAGAADAAGTAERLRAAVRGLVIEIPPGRRPGDARPGPVAGGAVRDLSVSIGVAARPAGGTDLDALLAAADAACYRAKREGRDRVLTAGPGD